LYYNGELGSKDPVQAAKWFRKAAEQGDSMSAELLAKQYLNGEGVPQDYAQAALWYRSSAEHSSAGGDSALELGKLYAEGMGVPQDLVQAHMWLTQADIARVARVAKALARNGGLK
jgi:TPR repeat protein